MCGVKDKIYTIIMKYYFISKRIKKKFNKYFKGKKNKNKTRSLKVLLLEVNLTNLHGIKKVN